MSDELTVPEPVGEPDQPGADNSLLRQSTPRPVDAGIQEPVNLPLDVEAFYVRNHPRYRQYATEILGDRKVAEEIVHEVFLCIAYAWDDLITEPDFDETAWNVLAGAVMHELHASHRVVQFKAHLRAARATLDQMRATIARMAAQQDSGIGLYDALCDLPERQFDVLILRRLNGYTSEFTGKVLGIHTRTVDYHLRRGMDALDQNLQAFGILHPTDPNRPDEGGR